MTKKPANVPPAEPVKQTPPPQTAQAPATENAPVAQVAATANAPAAPDAANQPDANSAPVNLPVLPQSGMLRASDYVDQPTPPDIDPEAERRSFVAQSRVKIDGQRHGPGSVIQVDRLTHARLKADKAIIGGWHDGLPGEPLFMSDAQRARLPRLTPDAMDDPALRESFTRR